MHSYSLVVFIATMAIASLHVAFVNGNKIECCTYKDTKDGKKCKAEACPDTNTKHCWFSEEHDKGIITRGGGCADNDYALCKDKNTPCSRSDATITCCCEGKKCNDIDGGEYKSMKFVDNKAITICTLKIKYSKDKDHMLCLLKAGDRCFYHANMTLEGDSVEWEQAWCQAASEVAADPDMEWSEKNQVATDKHYYNNCTAFDYATGTYNADMVHHYKAARQLKCYCDEKNCNEKFDKNKLKNVPSISNNKCHWAPGGSFDKENSQAMYCFQPNDVCYYGLDQEDQAAPFEKAGCTPLALHWTEDAHHWTEDDKSKIMNNVMRKTHAKQEGKLHMSMSYVCNNTDGGVGCNHANTVKAKAPEELNEDRFKVEFAGGEQNAAVALSSSLLLLLVIGLLLDRLPPRF